MSSQESSRVESLIAHWEMEHSAGRLITPEVLCHNDPELLDQVKLRLARLQQFPSRNDETKPFNPTNTVPESQGFREPERSPPPPLIPNISFERVLGQGGMGIVYLARQVQLNRLVAVKVIRSRIGLSEETVNRFRIEAETLAKFHNPHVVHVYEVGEYESQPYFVMEFIEGKTLREEIAQKPLSPLLAAEVAEKLSRAMQSIHERGIIHRDLKPSNIILDQNADAGRWKTSIGCPKIIDFGLVKQLDPSLQLTTDGQQLGTASYMAPEQVRGDIKSINATTDVYALGAILYEMLTGNPPFTGDSVLQIMEKVKTKKPVSPREMNANVPARLEAIVLKCLAKQQADRYSSATLLADDLEAWLRENEKNTQAYIQQSKRWRMPTMSAVLTGLLAAILFWMRSCAQPTPNFPEQTSPSTSRGTVPTALSIVCYDFKHFAKQGDRSSFEGDLGKSSFHAVAGDQIEMYLQLSEPAYSYLISFAANGNVELCYPEYESTPPTKDVNVRYPPAQASVRYGLTDGTGMYAFAIVSSAKPLPSFKEWRTRHPGLLTWKKVDGYSNVVYEHDGTSLKLITSDGLPPKELRGRDDPAPDIESLEGLASSLKKAETTATIKVIAFQVSSARGTSK